MKMPFFLKRKGILKIDQSAKCPDIGLVWELHAPNHRLLSMIKNACTVLLQDFFLVHWSQFLSCTAQGGEGGDGLKLEKNWPTISILDMVYSKNPKTLIGMVSLKKFFWYSPGLRNVVAFESTTKFPFSTSYDLKTAKIPWQWTFKCLFTQLASKHEITNLLSPLEGW